MVGDFLQKMQIARQEFEQGKAVREILFSDNPGIIPRRSTPIVTRPAVTRPTVTIPPRPTVTPPVVTRPAVTPPKPAVTPRPVVTPAPSRAPVPSARATEANRLQALLAKMKAEQEAKTRAATEKARQAAEEAKRRAAAKVPEPPTDVLSTLARGFARRTGIKPEPPPPYKEWLVP